MLNLEEPVFSLKHIKYEVSLLRGVSFTHGRELILRNILGSNQYNFSELRDTKSMVDAI